MVTNNVQWPLNCFEYTITQLSFKHWIILLCYYYYSYDSKRYFICCFSFFYFFCIKRICYYFFSRTLYNSMFTLNECIVKPCSNAFFFCWNECFEVFESGEVFFLCAAMAHCFALYSSEGKIHWKWAKVKWRAWAQTKTTYEKIA